MGVRLGGPPRDEKALDVVTGSAKCSIPVEHRSRGYWEPVSEAVSGDDETRIDGPADHRSGAPTPERRLAPGAALGRYAIIEELGRGGMGVVLRAYDPKLQREVALKILRTNSAEAESRMVREARAMAQLSHPNVVAIYDVTVGQRAAERSDAHEGDVMLAMEYVRGGTLEDWRDGTSRTVEEILRAFVQAGQGLHAAHREGLLHRDFKPANVLVGDDGRVRVTDFGLACLDTATTDHGETDGRRTDGDPSETGPPSMASLTEAGTVMGTPRYMAPEQHAAAPLSAAVDQYAFCVALWEALRGEPPFTGDFESLVRGKLEGPPSWPRGAAVPTRVVDALMRGLSVDPDARFGTLAALLEQLEPRPTLVRRVWAPGLAVVVTAGALTWGHAATRDDGQLCTGAADRLAEVWDDARKQDLADAFAGSEMAFASGVWDRIAPRMDAWADQWQAMHTEACEATRIRGEQSEAVMDLRVACLQRAKLGLDATARVLNDARPKAIQRAHTLVEGLPKLSACADLEALQAAVPPPPVAERDAVDAIRAELAEAFARLRAAEYDEALAITTRAREASEGLEYEPIRTLVWLRLGKTYDSLGRYEEAEDALRRVRELGAHHEQWDAVRSATLSLMYVLGYRQERQAEALALSDLAAGLVRGVPEHEARLHSARGIVLRAQGEYEEAELEQRAAVALRVETLGADHIDVGTSRLNLANVLVVLGRYEEAEVEARAVIEIRTKVLGPDHPEVGGAQTTLGGILKKLGRLDDAELELRAALATKIAGLGADHPSVALTRNLLANTLDWKGDYAGAEAEHRTALASFIETLGAEHSNVAASRLNLANALYPQGKHAEAEAEFRAALAIFNELLKPDNPRVATARDGIANVLYLQGRYAEAEAEKRDVIELRTAALGAEHPLVASSRSGLASILTELGRGDEAEAEMRATLELETAALGPEHATVALNRTTLATILFRFGKAREAESEMRTALPLLVLAQGDDHPEVAKARREMGEILMGRGAVEEALPLLRRAWTHERDGKSGPARRGASALALARALYADPAEHERARELARTSITAYSEAGPGGRRGLAEAESWLATHR